MEYWQLLQRQSLPLEAKILHSQVKIRDRNKRGIRIYRYTLQPRTTLASPIQSLQTRSKALTRLLQAFLYPISSYLPVKPESTYKAKCIHPAYLFRHIQAPSSPTRYRVSH